MAANSRRSNNGQILRSPSPPGKLYSSKYKTTSYGSTSTLLNRSTSPTRVFNSTGSTPSNGQFNSDRRKSLPRSTSLTRTSGINESVASSSSSVRFGLNRTQNPRNWPVSVSTNCKPASPSQTKRTCLCSPTNHPGSFRCSLHKNTGNKTTSIVPNKLERSAIANSLMKLGAVEGNLVKRALAVLIRPSSHQLRRRENFQRRPSRLSAMS